MTYHDAVHFAQTYGLLYLCVLFAGVLAYALWPGNKEKFDRAARRSLEED